MTVKNFNRDQHTVSELHYRKQKLKNDSVLYVQDFDNSGAWKKRGVGKISVEDAYYYSPVNYLGSYDMFTDQKILQPIESKAGNPYKRLLETKNPDCLIGTERIEFCDFLSTTLLRTPKIRDKLLQMTNFENNSDNLKTLHNKLIEDYRKFSTILFNMNWIIAEAQHGFFITGDAPVTYTDALGLAHKDTHLVFPLSSKLVLLTANCGRMREYALLPRKSVDEINAAIIQNCERFICSHVPHGDISRMIRKYKKRV